MRLDAERLAVLEGMFSRFSQSPLPMGKPIILALGRALVERHVTLPRRSARWPNFPRKSPAGGDAELHQRLRLLHAPLGARDSLILFVGRRARAR
jgi:hypothetical protein